MLASHDSNGVALLTWQAAGEWSVRACVQTMCHSEPGSYQACGAEGPSACRRLGLAILGRAANVEAADFTYMCHVIQWRPAVGRNDNETAPMGVFRASTLGRSAGWQGSQGHMCGGALLSSPKTVILRRAPDRLSTISTTGSCTGQTTMLCEGSPRDLVHPLRWIASLRVS